jgi:antirestriction protein ArdC
LSERRYAGTTNYSKEELTAEMAAAFLCAHAGIANCTVDNSAAYIGGWLERLAEDGRLVVHAASAAQKAADYTLGDTATAPRPSALSTAIEAPR